MLPFSSSRRRATRRHRIADLRSLKTTFAEARKELRDARLALDLSAARQSAARTDLSRVQKQNHHRESLLAAVFVPALMLTIGHVQFGVLALTLDAKAFYWAITAPSYIFAAVTGVTLTVVALRSAAAHKRDVLSQQTKVWAAESSHQRLEDSIRYLAGDVAMSRSAIRERKRR